MVARGALVCLSIAMIFVLAGCGQVANSEENDATVVAVPEVDETAEVTHPLSQSILKAGEFAIDVSNPEFRHFRDGAGERKFRRHVDLTPPFPAGSQVKVIASLAAIDAERAANLRIVVSTEATSPQGFDAVLTTWEDTRIWLVKVTWLAYVE